MKKFFFVLLLGIMPVVANAQLVKTSTITVKKIKKEKKVLEPVKPRFQQSVEFTWNLGLTGNNMDFSFRYIGGYRFNNWFFLGAGVGYDMNPLGDVYYSHDHYGDYENRFYVGTNFSQFPLFVHLRTYLTKSRVNPYFGLSGGAILHTRQDIECHYYQVSIPTGYTDREYKTGVFRGMLEPSFGMNIRMTNKCDFYLAFSALLSFDPFCERDNYKDSPSTVYKLVFNPGFHLGVSF